MKKLISSLSLVSFCVFSAAPLSSEVLESSDIAISLVMASPNTLYIFDLDNTLIEPKQLLGSDQWVGYQIEKLRKKGLSMQEAVAEVIPAWLGILKKTEMRLVDPVIPSLLQTLIQKQIPCIGLTKRDPAACHQTIEQLDKLQIEFQPYEKEKSTDLFPEGTLYKGGVLFTGKGVDKGKCLISYLRQFSNLPSHIVAIDDKMSHLQSLEKASQALGISFIGIRYSKTDERVKNFDPRIAEIQWNHLNSILSDEEAKQLMSLSR